MQNGSQPPEDSRAYSVVAVLEGEVATFALGRDQAATWRMQKLFRAGSAFAQFQAFSVGAWNTEDVRTVLVEAYAGDDDPLLVVERALLALPVGRLAPLAVKILEAFLFGVPTARARFDDSDPFEELAAA